MHEKFCPQHGPYDAALAECPYCAAESRAPESQHPRPPSPLSSLLEDGATAVDGEDVFQEEALLESSAEAEENVEEHTLVDQPPQPASALRGLLWVKTGPAAGKIFPVGNGSVIGRTTGAITLQDARVSNPHAKITLEEGQFVVWDFGSSNGTWVNGQRIREATPLAENDEIRVGESVLVLKTLSLGG